MASKIAVNLDTSKEIFLNSKCKQNDDLILECNIFENGLALDLTNKEISIQALKADKTYIIQNTDITKENNKFIANLVRDFSRVPGTTKIEIVLVESSKQNTTFSFCLEVVGSVIKGTVESGNTPTILETLQKKIVEAGQVKQETEKLIEKGGAATKGDIQEVNANLEQKTDKNYVNEKIATVQLQGAGVDTTNFVVKTELIENLNPLEEVMYNNYLIGTDLNWVNQYISNTTGNGTASDKAIRCTNFPSNMDLLMLVANGSEYIFRIAEYNRDWTFKQMLITDLRVDRYIFKKEKYYRISVFKKDKSTLTDDERTLIKNSITIKKLRMTDDEIKSAINSKQTIYSGLSNYLLNRLSYVPFCNPYVPKIAFVDDDGYESVLNTTIPLFESKNLPLTVACWSTSHVFDTDESKSKLISKLGEKLEIAQHTMVDMTGKTEEELRTYFEEQKSFWNTNNIAVNSMVYGYNTHDSMLRCVVSDYFKLACQGTNSTLSNNTNRYALNRVRVQTASNLNAYKGYIDKAIANKESLIFFWHSNEITDNTELYNCLSSLLDYVNTKINQITPVLLSNLI